MAATINKTTHGGARRGAGRKPREQLREVREMLNEAWPLEIRAQSFRVLVARVQAGDFNAARLLMAYAYGTPVSLDAQAIAEAVQNEIDALMEHLKENLDAATFRKVEAALE